MLVRGLAAACCAILLGNGACEGTHRVPDSGADAGVVPTCCDSGEPGSDAGSDAGSDPGSDAGSAPSPCHGQPTDRDIRALFVGNSQIEFWDMPQLVASLSESAPANCARITSERFTMGGANLRDLWEGTDDRGRRLIEVLSTGDYDVVVLAESIDLVEMRPPYPEQFRTVATEVAAAVSEAGALPVFYATPYIETADHLGFHEMADPQIALGGELGVPVAAGGLAWLRVWAEQPSEDLYYLDRAHPGFHGSYVSALVIWAAITGGNPIGLTTMPSTTCDDGGCTPISAEQGDLYQRAARAEHLATGL